MKSNSLSTLEEISSYRRSHPAACLIVDTNTLLLFLIGNFDKDYLKECPLMLDNGKCYTEKHFDLIQKIVSIFINKIYITPHILSEVNMLTRKKIKAGGKIKDFFEKIVKQLEKCNEEQVGMEVILRNGGLIKFGFTDISLVEAASKNEWAIITDEIQLYITYNEKLPVIYFSSVVASEIDKVSL